MTSAVPTTDTRVTRLGTYAAGLQYEDLPAVVAEKAKICILDILGIAVGGSQMPATQVTQRAFDAVSAPGQATVWMSGRKGLAHDCALPNSVMAHCILQDDWLPVSHAHIGAAVVPTVFAVAEELGASGREALAATVAGYEVEDRAGSVSVGAFTRGFRASSVYANFGTAAAASRLMKLPAGAFTAALSCAGSVTGGVLQPWVAGSTEWAFQEGFACRNGILAATLAREGLVGCVNVLEGTHGVNRSFSGTFENQDATVAGIGTDFRILQTCFKRFCSGGAKQGSAAVAWALWKKHATDIARIRRIDVDIPSVGAHERMNYAGIPYTGPFRTVDQCLISKPFAIACLLKTGKLDINTVCRERDNPHLLTLARKIHLREVTGINGWQLRMRVELDDGTEIRGDGDDIDQSYLCLTWSNAVEKFLELAAGRLGAQAAREIVDLVHRMEELPGVGPIVQRMVPRGSR